MERYRPEQIVKKLRHASAELDQVLSAREVCHHLEPCEQVHCRQRPPQPALLAEALGSSKPPACSSELPRLWQPRGSGVHFGPRR